MNPTPTIPSHTDGVWQEAQNRRAGTTDHSGASRSTLDLLPIPGSPAPAGHGHTPPGKDVVTPSVGQRPSTINGRAQAADVLQKNYKSVLTNVREVLYSPKVRKVHFALKQQAGKGLTEEQQTFLAAVNRLSHFVQYDQPSFKDRIGLVRQSTSTQDSQPSNWPKQKIAIQRDLQSLDGSAKEVIKQAHGMLDALFAEASKVAPTDVSLWKMSQLA